MEEQNVITRNKGGRPKKTIKRDQLMAVKCTLYERKAIEARAKSVNLSISEYWNCNLLLEEFTRQNVFH